MSDRPILIVHPYDNTTIFLDRVKNHLINNFNSITHYYNVKCHEVSHQQCLERISSHPDEGVIIFLGHGKSDSLCGSKGKLYETIDYVSKDAIEENPSDYFYKETFIDYSNINVFKKKKIICLSCNSNGKIANLAMDAGAKSFVGFGDLPTSASEFKEKYTEVSNELVTKMKSELNFIIKRSLFFAISQNLTFESFHDYIRFIANQKITNILIKQKEFSQRTILADNIYYLKNEAKIFGNKRLKLIG